MNLCSKSKGDVFFFFAVITYKTVFRVQIQEGRTKFYGFFFSLGSWLEKKKPHGKFHDFCSNFSKLLADFVLQIKVGIRFFYHFGIKLEIKFCGRFFFFSPREKKNRKINLWRGREEKYVITMKKKNHPPLFQIIVSFYLIL